MEMVSDALSSLQEVFPSMLPLGAQEDQALSPLQTNGECQPLSSQATLIHASQSKDKQGIQLALPICSAQDPSTFCALALGAQFCH